MEGGGETKKTVTCISSEPCVFGEDEGEGPYNLFMADGEPSRVLEQLHVRQDTKMQGRAVRIWKWF